ncbi:MAG: flagellar hook protein FlgE [Hyphomicrobiaceae bacterium]
MSINGLMNTSVSGMEAQANRLGSVAGNIANASTIGYKAADAKFSSLLIDTPGTGSFPSGGVESHMRYGISRQGVLESSGSQYDLAISGSGFLLVRGTDGNDVLTRAGAFVPDSNGNLVNSAGYTLLGLPASSGGASSVVINGTAGLVPVSVRSNHFEAAATTAAAMPVNLPLSDGDVAAADLPSLNAANSVSSERSSVVVYGSLGEEITLDVHYARTTTPGEWEVTVFNAADRSASGGFPYASGPLAQGTMVFDGNGQLDTSGTTSLSIPVPGGATMDLDFTGSSQLAEDYTVLKLDMDGNPPSAAASIEIASDGTIYEVYGNGTRRAAYVIPLATVASPDNMIQKSGNIFVPTGASGNIMIGAADSAGYGSLVSGSLESSNVDLASELTSMIEAQRNYTANSKVFQAGAELLDVLVNLKR